jgi:hypothetical protein
MTRLRTVLVLGVATVGLVGAAATAWVVNADPAHALRGVLAVQGGTVVALAVAVWVLLGPTVSRLAELIEALHAFARGERHTRVNPADFAGLADVARAVNDVGASLCENDDPNLGPVQKKTRDKPIRRPGSDTPRPSSTLAAAVPRPSSSSPSKPAAVASPPASPTPSGVGRTPIIEGDGVGEVRRRGRADPAPAPAAPPTPMPVAAPATSAAESVVPSEAETVPPVAISAIEGVSEPRTSRKNRRKNRRAQTQRPTSTDKLDDKADENVDESVDDGDDSLNSEDVGAAIAAASAAPADDNDAVSSSADAAADSAVADSAVADSAVADADDNATVIEAAPSELPSREDLMALFDEFRREKRGAGQSDGVDVDFDAFADTILAESERLIAEHQCRGVRFEVAVAEGEVSLRPRLLR